MTPHPTIEDAFAELVEEFDFLRATADELGLPAKDFIGDHIIDLGKALEPLPEADRVSDNKVPGCVAQVWLVSSAENGILRFRADSDSTISKGNIALLLRLYSGRSPTEILTFDARSALERLGVPSALSCGRANGLNAMVGRIRDAAAAAAQK